MLNLNRWFVTACTLSLVWGMPVPGDSAWAQTEAPAPAEEGEAPLEEEAELPAHLLILPEEDPAFVPDPNQVPLEQDFLFMPQARDPLFWRLEWRESLGGVSQAEPVPGGSPSLTHRSTLTGLLRYTLPSETQILARSQAFLFNYFNAPQQDQLLGIPLSLTVSQWWDRWNVYAGYVPMVYGTLQRGENNIQRFDQDFLAGATYYLPLDQHYVFAGYQLDYLLAQQENARFWGHQALVGYRHTLNKDLFAFVDARVQPRSYMGTEHMVDELRLGAGAAIQWHVLRPWLILEGRTDYNQNVSFASADRNTGIFSLGINIIGAIQSQN